MSGFAFALRRAFRSIAFPLSLLALTAAVLFTASLGRSAALPPAGLCNEDGGEAAARICATLLQSGFVECAGRDELYSRVSSGELDCGIILYGGLGERLRTGELRGAAGYVHSPSSYLPQLYRSHAAAALLGEYAPYSAYLALDALGTDISEADTVAAYRELAGGGAAFTLDVVTEDGAPVRDDARARAMTTAAAALLIFTSVTACSCSLLTGELKSTAKAIGLKNAVYRVLLPSLLTRAALAAAFAAAGLLAARYALGALYAPGLVLPVFVYALLLVAAGLMLAALLPTVRYLYILMPVLLVASLALCPVYSDIALRVPALAAARCVLPPYWLWLIPEAPLPWLAASLAALPLSVFALLLRYRAAEKLR